MSTFRGALTAVIFFGVTLVLMPLQLLFVAFGSRAGLRLPVIYHRLMLRLIGVRVKFEGEIVDGPALLASNHTSWLDVSVLASIAPLSFIAKREVRSWPLFGQLARLQRTVFVDRERRSQTGAAKSEMERRFEAGERLVLFAEGTSDDGNSVKPFRTALFGAATTRVPRRPGDEPEALQVQPVSIAYVKLQGLPMGRLYRPDFAWYGDMEMGPHLWGVFRAGPIDAVVRLHGPVTIEDVTNRKALAAHCEAVVRAGVASALLGRRLRPKDVRRPGPIDDVDPAIAEAAGNR